MREFNRDNNPTNMDLKASLDSTTLGGKGRTRLICLGLGGVGVTLGVALGIILHPSVKATVDELISKDNEHFRQISQMYRPVTPEGWIIQERLGYTIAIPKNWQAFQNIDTDTYRSDDKSGPTYRSLIIVSTLNIKDVDASILLELAHGSKIDFGEWSGKKVESEIKGSKAINMMVTKGNEARRVLIATQGSPADIAEVGQILGSLEFKPLFPIPVN